MDANEREWKKAGEAFVKIGRATDRAGSDVLRDFGNAAMNEMRRLMSAGGRGGLVVRYRPKRAHRRSAPGDAPATDLGRLVNSIGMREELAGDVKTVSVGAAAAYALPLEVGTSKMAARPFIRPSVQTAAEQMRARAVDTIDGAQRRAV